jgi:hypothetical protein
LDDAIGQGRLAMVDVSDDGEIADMVQLIKKVLIQHLGPAAERHVF